MNEFIRLLLIIIKACHIKQACIKYLQFNIDRTTYVFKLAFDPCSLSPNIGSPKSIVLPDGLDITLST